MTSATNFGWVHLNTTGTTGFPATIVDYAYEDSGGQSQPARSQSQPPSHFLV